MSPNTAALLYLVAGVLFILALRGLSSPATSRQGNLFGMIGMAIAIVVTLASHPPASLFAWILVIVGLGIGGGAGAVIARRVPMTSMPELVAAFHSLVGMAAVLVAAAALYAPRAFDIGVAGRHPEGEPDRDVARRRDRRRHVHRLDHRVPQALRAHERRADPAAGAPRHQYRARGRDRAADRLVRAHRELLRVLAADARGLRVRRAHHHPDRRRRHAGRDLDAQLLFGLGRGRHRLHARQLGADHHRRAGRLLGRDPLLHHVQGDEPQLHLGHSRRLRRRGRGAGRRAPSSGRSSSARPTTPPSS